MTRSILWVAMIILVSSTKMPGQYLRLLNDGVKLYDDENYELAIAKFVAAGKCDDRPTEGPKVSEWFEWQQKAQNAWVNYFRNLVNEKERARQRSIAYYEAYRAVQELERGNDSLALKLAYDAYSNILDNPLDYVTETFGRVVFQIYGQVHPSQQYLRFSETDEQFLTLENDSEIMVNRGKERHLKIEAGEAPVVKVLFSPSMDRIVALFKKNYARLWDTEGKLVATLEHPSLVTEVMIANGQKFITASRDGLIRCWDADGRLLTEFIGHEGNVLAMEFSPQGDFLLSRSEDITAKLWTLAGAGKLQKNIDGHRIYLKTATFSPQGDLIVTGGYDKKIILWSHDGQQLASFELDGEVRYAGISPSGRYLMGLSNQETIAVWKKNAADDWSTHVVISPGEKGNAFTQFLRDAVPSPTEDKLLTYSKEGRLTIWDLEEGRADITLDAHKDDITLSAYSPMGDYILTLSKDYSAKLWDSEGRIQLIMEFESEPVKAGFSADNTHFFVFTVSGSAVVVPFPALAFDRLRKHPPALTDAEKKQLGLDQF